MRLSDYTIFIPVHNEQCLTLHGYTGAVDLISSGLYEALSSTGEINEDIREKLIGRGYLTDKTSEEETQYVHRIARALTGRNSYLKKNFSFIVSYACNFKCPYCFEKGRLNNHTHKQLTSKGVDLMYDALMHIEPNRQLHNDVITLFGGEPLLRTNKARVGELITKGCEHGYQFTATTNGYDLDQYAEFLGEGKLFGVQITMDGAENLHNSRRFHNSGRGSFRKILSNIDLALKYGAKVKVRVNVDATNVDDLGNLLDILQSEGILSHPHFGIYAEHISGEGNFCPDGYAPNEGDLPVSEFVEKLTHTKPPIPFDIQLYSNLKNAITYGRSLSLSSQHCGANSTTYILDPDGAIYACYDFVGSDNQIIGNYIPALVFDEAKMDYWHNRQIAKTESCAKCKYALICGGGCQAKAINTGRLSCCDDFESRLSAVAKHILNATSPKIN